MAMKTLTHHQFDEDESYRSFRAKREFIDLKLCTATNPTDIVLGHRAILGAVSTTLKNLMKKSPNSEDTIILKNPVYENLVSGRSMISLIVEFIYEGKLTIPEEKFEDFSDCYRMLNIKLGGSIDKIKEEDDDEDETIAAAPMTMIKMEALENEDLQKPIISSCSEDNIPNEGLRWPNHIEEALGTHLGKNINQSNPQPLWHQPLTPQNHFQQLPPPQPPHPMHFQPPAPPHQISQQYLPESAYIWIKVENVKTDLQKDQVRDNFNRFGSKDFRVDPLDPVSCYVAFETEKEAEKNVEILRNLPMTKQYKIRYMTNSELPDCITDNKHALMKIKERIRPPLPAEDGNAASKPPLPPLLAKPPQPHSPKTSNGFDPSQSYSSGNTLSERASNPGKRGQESTGSEPEYTKKSKMDYKMDIFLPLEHKKKICGMLHPFLHPRLTTGQIGSKVIFKVLMRELTHRVLEERGHTIEIKEVETIVKNIFVMYKTINDEDQAKRAIKFSL